MILVSQYRHVLYTMQSTICLVASPIHRKMTLSLMCSRILWPHCRRHARVHCRHPGLLYYRRQPMSTWGVTDATHRPPEKRCALDTVPICLQKASCKCVAAFLADPFNWSQQSGRIPCKAAPFKSAYIEPLIKKSGLGALCVWSYRTIYNLFVVSKLPEGLVAWQLCVPEAA